MKPITQYLVCIIAESFKAGIKVPGGIHTQMEFTTPFGNRQRFPAIGKKSRTAPIIQLHMDISPPAIIRRVWSIAIDAVKGQSRWRFSHISKKVLEVQPSFANSNTSAPIPYPACMAGIAATSYHALPDTIRACFRASVDIPLLTDSFAPQATATSGESFTQRGTPRTDVFPAITNADPVGTTSIPRTGNTVQSYESPESLVPQIYKARHLTNKMYYNTQILAGQ